jgi:hypothetical protein
MADDLTRPSGFNEGYHSGYNSALAYAANALREEAMKRYGFEAFIFNKCANLVRSLMRLDPAGDGI